MKKILGIFLIAGAFVACNNEAETTEVQDTQTITTPEQTPIYPSPADTMNTSDTMNMPQ